MDQALRAAVTDDDPVLTVLIVVPDLFFRKRLRGQLQEAGYTVAEALSVERALARVVMEAPDLVVLDTWTDGGDGLTLLEAMRASEDWRHIPVLLFGDDTRPHVRGQARQLGALGPIPLDSTAGADLWVTEALSSP